MKRYLILTLLACLPAIVCADRSGGKSAVSIKGMRFTPASLNIHTGDTVVWTNADDHDHTVDADDGSFQSGKLGSGDTFEHAFKSAGTFGYSCSFHPRMKGTITVGN